MKIPVIGISGSIMKDSGGMFPGYKRAYVNDDYIQAVLNAGGIPVILPMIEDAEKIKDIIGKIDGLLLSGGHDVNPLLYGEEPDVKTTEIYPKRDKYDFELIKCATEKQIPIMGVCRGMQIMNTYFGGSNYQDNCYKDGSYVKHWQGHSPNMATHTMQVDEDSKLGKILGTELMINSFHHQSVKKVANGFVAVAKAKDGIIEAIEKSGNHWCIGLQFHPEMMAAKDENMKLLFKTFVKESSESGGN